MWARPLSPVCFPQTFLPHPLPVPHSIHSKSLASPHSNTFLPPNLCKYLCIFSVKNAFLEDITGPRKIMSRIATPHHRSSLSHLSLGPARQPYLSKLRWTVVLLPGARTLLLPATHAPTPATAHETLCTQTTPTGEEVAAAGALDRYLEDLGVAERWLRVTGGRWGAYAP